MAYLVDGVLPPRYGGLEGQSGPPQNPKLDRPTMLGRLIENRFVRQVAVLLVGTGVAQILTIVAAPIITRLYDPSAMGLSGTLATITSFIAVVASLRFDGALLVESDETWAHHIFTLSLLALAGVVFLTLSALRSVTATASAAEVSSTFCPSCRSRWRYWASSN